MSYLVMECHPAYVIVLDDQGRFLKAANLHYEVGQTLEQVVLMEEKPKRKRRWAPLAAAAACLCLMVLSGWRMMTPVGTVRMQINPDVMISVNRWNYAVGLRGLNEDGEILAENVDYLGKKVDLLSDELADRAVELGYLSDGGRITLTVDSADEKWKVAAEELLVLELEVHFQQKVVVAVTLPETPDAPPAGEEPPVISAGQVITIPADDDDDDDDRWDDDDDRDDAGDASDDDRWDDDDRDDDIEDIADDDGDDDDPGDDADDDTDDDQDNDDDDSDDDSDDDADDDSGDDDD